MSNPLLVGVVIGAFFPGPLGPVPVVTTGRRLQPHACDSGTHATAGAGDEPDVLLRCAT